MTLTDIMTLTRTHRQMFPPVDVLYALRDQLVGQSPLTWERAPEDFPWLSLRGGALRHPPARIERAL